MAVWLVRIWTYKNADEKGPTCPRKSKNVKKRIPCQFTLTHEVKALKLKFPRLEFIPIYEIRPGLLTRSIATKRNQHCRSHCSNQ